MQPSKKSSQVEEVLTTFFGFDRRVTIASGKCGPPPIGCGGDAPIDSFRDERSRREFTISSLCQLCQDKIFTEPEEE